MKIIECMKELKLIEKKIQSNAEQIQKYASAVTTERYPFDTEVEQRKAVTSLIQSSQDLMREYLKLKTRLDQTNLATMVMVEGTEDSIANWLIVRRKMGQAMAGTFAALNTREGDNRLRNAVPVDNTAPQVITFYDEQDKNDMMAYWKNVVDRIDPILEVVNATTDLL